MRPIYHQSNASDTHLHLWIAHHLNWSWSYYYPSLGWIKEEKKNKKTPVQSHPIQLLGLTSSIGPIYGQKIRLMRSALAKYRCTFMLNIWRRPVLQAYKGQDHLGQGTPKLPGYPKVDPYQKKIQLWSPFINSWSLWESGYEVRVCDVCLKLGV